MSDIGVAFDMFIDGDVLGSKKELQQIVRSKVNDHLKYELGLSGDAFDSDTDDAEYENTEEE